MRMMYLKQSKIILVISLFMTALILSSCRFGIADITNEEARQILNELIPAAEELNEIFLGKGLEPSEYEDSGIKSSAAKYIVVSPNAKYQTVGELSTAAEAIFSEEYCAVLFESAFVGTDEFSSRYSESTDGKLQININDEGYDLRTKLFPEQAVVKNKYSGKTAISIPAEFNGKPCDDVIIYLVEENGKWLIDSPTY